MKYIWELSAIILYIAEHDGVQKFPKTLLYHLLCTIIVSSLVHIFYKQLDFHFGPGVASEFCRKKAESCLLLSFIGHFSMFQQQIAISGEKWQFFPISTWEVACELLGF